MDLRDLAPIGVLFVVIAIALSMGGEILSSLSNQQTGAAQNITNYGTEGISKIAKWLPTIALVIAAAVVIGVVLTSFILRRK